MSDLNNNTHYIVGFKLGLLIIGSVATPLHAEVRSAFSCTATEGRIVAEGIDRPQEAGREIPPIFLGIDDTAMLWCEGNCSAGAAGMHREGETLVLERRAISSLPGWTAGGQFSQQTGTLNLFLAPSQVSSIMLHNKYKCSSVYSAKKGEGMFKPPTNP